MSGYLIDANSAKRLGRMLHAYEGGGVADGRRGSGDIPRAGATPPVNVVKVTGAMNASGWWPGYVRLWDNTTKGYANGSLCRIYEINSAALSSIQYLGRLAGYDAGASPADPQIPVYLVQARDVVASGSGSGSGSGDSGSVGSGSGDSGSVGSGSVGSGSGDSGSVGSGSGDSGSGDSGVSGSGGVSGGSSPCGGSGTLLIEVVTDVQCVNGAIVVTKTTIAIPGGVLC